MPAQKQAEFSSDTADAERSTGPIPPGIPSFSDSVPLDLADVKLLKLGCAIPEWCSPLQALRCFVDHRLPLSESDAWVSGEEIDTQEKKYRTAMGALIVGLSNGHLKARGSLQLTPSSNVVEDGFGSTWLNWQLFINRRQIELGVAKHDEYFAANSELIPPALWHHKLFSFRYGELRCPRECTSKVLFFRVQMETASLLKIFKDKTSVTVRAVDASKVGRPTKYNWEEFQMELSRRYFNEGQPKTLNEMAEKMAQWCAMEWGVEPAISEIRKRVSAHAKRLTA